jgi:hypothetical protein
MFVDRVIEGEKHTPFPKQFCAPEIAITSLLLETHSLVFFIAHTIFALFGVGMMTSTSFEVKGEIRKQTIQLPVKSSTTIFKIF